MHPQHPRRATTPSTRAESGFGVLELLVVMVIMCVLAAILLLTFNGAKGSAREREGIAAASSYSQAISAYMADHGNKLPSDQADLTERGPMNLLDKPYMKGPASGVTEGRVGVSMDGSNCDATAAAPSGVGGQTAWVSFCGDGGAPNYAFRVLTKKENGWTEAEGATLCWLGNTAKVPRCGEAPAASPS